MRVLVIFHAYYADYIRYYLDRLKNISGCSWDLTVTCCGLPDDARKEIQELKEDTRFMEVPNVGYDVWPFIHAVKNTDLSEYDFVIKLHTKNRDSQARTRVNGRNYDGRQWRDIMVNVLIGSPAAFGRVLEAFGKKDTGIVYAMETDVISNGATVEDSTMLSDELERLGISPADRHFCAGTMFAVRASALGYLKDPKIGIRLFEPTGKSHASGTYAHVYERIFTIAVSAMGYRRVLIAGSLASRIRLTVKNCVQPALEWLFSIDHYGDNYDKCLTLFGIRIPIKKNR